jgi:hypothetical protein
MMGYDPNLRYNNTIAFIKKHVGNYNKVLDLGTPNVFSEIMKANGFTVLNTKGEDLDLNPNTVTNFDNIEFVTALEIFEHLINPLSVLINLPSNKLVASIPLSLWFAKAYRSKTDNWDRHFHEFEEWQFDWLLEKAGWKIVDSERWPIPTQDFGIRPLLRRFVPRIYIVYAERE